MKRLFPFFFVMAAVLLLTAFGCRPKNSSVNGNTNNANNAPLVVQRPSDTNAAINTAQPVRPTTEQELQRLALAFAERYGSYSNQTNFANLENLLVFMTQKFSNQTANTVAQERAKKRDTTVYYGITTKAVTVRTGSFSENLGTATFLIGTLRREAIGSTSNVKNYQQSLELRMTKEDGVWKVDGAIWK